MRQNPSRIKFEPRGLDSRQSFGGWLGALEYHLTALTTPDLTTATLADPSAPFLVHLKVPTPARTEL